MKSIYSSILAVLPLLSSVLGAPASGAELAPRTPGNVFICTGSGYTNTCAVKSYGTGGTCFKLDEPWFESIGSAGPDRGAICRLFENSSCTGSGLAILQYPGNDNLYGTGNDAGHKAQYISCHECTACQ